MFVVSLQLVICLFVTFYFTLKVSFGSCLTSCIFHPHQFYLCVIVSTCVSFPCVLAPHGLSVLILFELILSRVPLLAFQTFCFCFFYLHWSKNVYHHKSCHNNISVSIDLEIIKDGVTGTICMMYQYKWSATGYMDFLTAHYKFMIHSKLFCGSLAYSSFHKTAV